MFLTIDIVPLEEFCVCKWRVSSKKVHVSNASFTTLCFYIFHNKRDKYCCVLVDLLNNRELTVFLAYAILRGSRKLPVEVISLNELPITLQFWTSLQKFLV